MALNNEVSILNIANIDNDIKDATTRSMIANEELTEYATHNYDVNQLFIWNDRKLYRTMQQVNIGTQFIIGVNVQLAGNISTQLYELYSQSSDNIRELISNFEPTMNASRAYSYGEYIVLNDGFLYRVVANLSFGTLWRENVNIIRVDNVTALVNELEASDSNIKNIMVSVENTNVASRAYDECEEFVFNNQLVKATSPISKYGTITLGGNCEAVDNLASQVGELRKFGVWTAKGWPISSTALTSGTVTVYVPINLEGWNPVGVGHIEQTGTGDSHISIVDWHIEEYNGGHRVRIRAVCHYGENTPSSYRFAGSVLILYWKRI